MHITIAHEPLKHWFGWHTFQLSLLNAQYKVDVQYMPELPRGTESLRFRSMCIGIFISYLFRFYKLLAEIRSNWMYQSAEEEEAEDDEDIFSNSHSFPNAIPKVAKQNHNERPRASKRKWITNNFNMTLSRRPFLQLSALKPKAHHVGYCTFRVKYFFNAENEMHFFMSVEMLFIDKL